ncbi:hypothetical protein PF004_g11157 [Phytophthora fragariae]|uniref:Myb/SANT-like domain-containing protein n=2 Tax=Phytophthora fragariae TaxID=53985 RepID=A0A6G0NYR7_9STRA|nr:hypothetical protein PF004_g11157 [Phytophthora fragariae]
MKWTNKMVGELLRLRFDDAEVMRRLEGADTKTKKALAWQFFASKIPQALGVVLNQEQVSQKYRKLKCVYRKEKRAREATGNRFSDEPPLDPALGEILHGAFSARVGISGAILLDSHVNDDDDAEDDDDDAPDAPSPAPKAQPPIVELAGALREGMEAIASSMGSRAGNGDKQVRALAEAVRAQTTAIQLQHRETRRILEMQLQLLRKLLEK